MIKIKVAKRDLEEALAVVKPAMATGGTDVSNHVLFRVDADKREAPNVLGAYTFSNRVFASCPVTAQVEGEGAFTIDGKRLSMWLEGAPDAPLGIIFEEGNVELSGEDGSVVLPSLDPEGFPFWDAYLDSLVVKASIPGGQLKGALSFLKGFAYKAENIKPEMCLMEVIDGRMYAADFLSVGVVLLPALKDTSLRIHRNDLSPLSSFLDKAREEPLEVLEHPTPSENKGVIFRRKDGAVFGESRFHLKFPTLTLDTSTIGHHTWVLSRQDMLAGITQVMAGADWEDARVRFVQDSKGLTISKPSAFRKGRSERSVRLISESSTEDISALLSEGFEVNQGALVHALRDSVQDEVTFQLITRKKVGAGYILFSEDRNGGQFHAILAFQR